MVGETNFNRIVGKRWESFDQVARRVEVFDVEQQWWKSLNAAGDQIQGRLVELPKWSQATAIHGEREKRATALAESNQAAAIDRLLAPTSKRTFDGPAAHRCLMIQDQLLWQADRAWSDHWSAIQPQAEPYYRTAGLTYLSDAQRLDPHQQLVKQLRSKLQQKAELVFDAPANIDLTSEQQLEIACELQSSPGSETPPGFPTIWMQGNNLVQVVSPTPLERISQPLGQSREKSRFVCTVASSTMNQAERSFSGAPANRPCSITLTALFRGQRLERRIPIAVHLRPELLTGRQPQPNVGSVAVMASPGLASADGVAQGAVTIVLDASGSMGSPPQQAFSPNAKYAEAVASIHNMLTDLPRGVVVSLWVFGQAWGPQKTSEKPEETIHRLIPPTVWNPQDPSQLTTLLKAIEYPAVEPWNESPLVQAILTAKNDLTGAQGFKSLIVITDGVDNRYEQQSGGVSVKQSLTEAFRGSGVEVNVLGFRVDNQEAEQAQKQFQVVQSFFPPGKVYFISEASELEDRLKNAVAPHLRCWIENYDSTPPSPAAAAGLEVSEPGANLRWLSQGLAPGGYRLRYSQDGTDRASLLLNGGDLLLLQAKRSPQGLTTSRVSAGKTFWSWKPKREKSGYRATVLQNQRTSDRAMQMLLTLEGDAQPDENVLQQLTPRNIWVEASPSKKGDSIAITWRREYGYAAPAYTLSADNWPAGDTAGKLARPHLRVWWSPDEQSPAAVILKKGREFETLPGLHDVNVSAFEQSATIESVAVEEHFVEISPGKRESRSCLVVRVRQASPEPLQIRCEGLSPAGEEHRYYTSAGKYAALFWPVTADQANESLTGIAVLSRAAFKRHAEKRGYYLEFEDLPAPSVNDTRPAPNWN